ncbi:MAG: hypothetical protein QY306_01780 [Anaerolineales bacterium]|nr:MAG: hypothetical protein QY306_01780 [Anaerolineales bacterium]
MTRPNDLPKFLRNTALVILLVALEIAVIFAATPPDAKHLYQASMLKSALLRDVPSPRIIIVGGSNVAFGIDSELMERELGVPVINDGLHVALGIAPLNEIKANLRTGDIVIISLEYYNFTDLPSFYGQPQFLADWVEFSPERIWYLHEPYKQMPSIFAMMLERKVNRQLNYYLYGFSYEAGRNFYSGDLFNEHGDFIGHLGEGADKKFDIADSVYPINLIDDAYVYLEDFNQYAKSKGALVFYEAQAHRQTNCERTGKKNLDRFFNLLKNRTTIPLLTNLDQLCLPDDYFYDTPYHLNEQGREVRTERLIQNLKDYLSENQ